MAKEIYQTKHIRIVRPDETVEIVSAPEGFSWIPYSPCINIAGKRYEYTHFCQDAIPYYREVAMAGVKDIHEFIDEVLMKRGA